jgi:hypothetical protein
MGSQGAGDTTGCRSVGLYRHGFSSSSASWWVASIGAIHVIFKGIYSVRRRTTDLQLARVQTDAPTPLYSEFCVCESSKRPRPISQGLLNTTEGLRSDNKRLTSLCKTRLYAASLHKTEKCTDIIQG